MFSYVHAMKRMPGLGIVVRDLAKVAFAEFPRGKNVRYDV